jgi:D-galactose 1-dehydrogenase
VKPIRIAIIGYGKIAEDQHVPSIQANPRLELVATSSRSSQGVAQKFTDWHELIPIVDG